MAGVRGGKRDVGDGGDAECDARSEWRVERGVGTECGCQSSAGLLHRGVPPWARSSKNRIFVGANEFAGEAGAGEDDARKRNGFAWSVGAVCEHGNCLEGE